MEYLNGPYLFKSMFSDDPEAEMLLCVPGVAPLIQTYPLPFMPSNPCRYSNSNLWKPFLDPALTFEHQMVDLCRQLFETGLSEHERRQMEVNSFFTAETKAMTNSQQQATQIIVKFEQQQNEVSCWGHKVTDESVNLPLVQC